jgi:hypothetical protein
MQRDLTAPCCSHGTVGSYCAAQQTGLAHPPTSPQADAKLVPGQVQVLSEITGQHIRGPAFEHGSPRVIVDAAAAFCISLCDCIPSCTCVEKIEAKYSYLPQIS